MEETLSVIIHGCKLARDLESNLPNLSGSPNDLSNSCNQIVRVFESAIHRLSSLTAMLMINSSSLVPPAASSYNDHQMAPVYGDMAPPEVQEWLKSSYTQAIAHQLLLLSTSSTNTSTTTITTTSMEQQQQQQMFNDALGVKMNMADSSSSSPSITIGDGEASIIGMMMRSSEDQQGSDFGTKIPPVLAVQRSRKRKDGVEKRTVRVAGPRIGNMEVPPDDGFTWRKYGQKEILGSTFPRGYYRCTHKSFYGCEAKKQVQRLDDHPNTFEVTYYAHHTCCHNILSSSSSAAYNMQLQGAGTTTTTNTSSREIMELQSSSSSSSVVELVDAIFNSGSSNSNSMDSIFPSFPHHHHHHHQNS